MKKILFPTDFSPNAKNAYKFAAALATVTGASIDFLHVYSFPFSGIEYNVSGEQMQELAEEKKIQINAKINAFCKMYPFNNIDEKIAVPGLFFEQEIIERSKEGIYDLIIMGTKGERNPLDKLMGSTTTRTMMNARCPVLAIPENAEFRKIEQITYATTFKANDTHFVEELMKFGRELGAKINFLHISKEPHKNVEEKLLVNEYPIEFVKFSVVSNLSIMDGVDKFIKKNRTDILAIYIPKRTLWERLFHSSFSKKVTFHTKTPLLIFHG